MTSRATASETYEIRFEYSRRGNGVGIALYDDGPDGPLAFMGDLLVAEGEPNPRLDSGFPDDAWLHVDATLTEAEGDYFGGAKTVREFLDFEAPDLLATVAEVLRTGKGTAVPRTFVTGRPLRLPKPRAGETPTTRAARLVRAWLGFRGRDEVGHRVYVHRSRRSVERGSGGNVGYSSDFYAGTIVYETRSWAYEFCEWYEQWADDRTAPRCAAPRCADEPEIEALSSYEIGVLR